MSHPRSVHPTVWEYDRLQRLPPEEQEVIGRWVWQRLLWSWRFWAASFVVAPFTLLSFLAEPVVLGAGGGRFVGFVVWVILHLPAVWVWNRAVKPQYRSALREFLVTLDAHEKENRDPREPQSVTSNSAS